MNGAVDATALLGVRRLTEQRAFDLGVNGCTALDDRLQAATQGWPVEEDAMAACAADDADVGADADDLPVESAARVFAVEAKDIADAEIHHHYEDLLGTAGGVDGAQQPDCFSTHVLGSASVDYAAGGVDEDAAAISVDTGADGGLEVAFLRADTGHQEEHVRSDGTDARGFLGVGRADDEADVSSGVP